MRTTVTIMHKGGTAGGEGTTGSGRVLCNCFILFMVERVGLTKRKFALPGDRLITASPAASGTMEGRSLAERRPLLVCLAGRILIGPAGCPLLAGARRTYLLAGRRPQLWLSRSS